MFGLTILDLLIIAAYTAAVVFLGYWLRLRARTRTRAHYYLGGRRFGKVLQIFASFGQGMAPEGPVGVMTVTFHNGIAGVWSSLLMIFCTPFYWITSPWLRRLRIMTMGDFYVERYGSRKMAATYVVIAAVGMMSTLSGGYLATALTALALTPKPAVEWTAEEKIEAAAVQERLQLQQVDCRRLSPEDRRRLEELQQQNLRPVFSYLSPAQVIWTACAITMLNSILGGLTAVVYTSVLQGFCLVALSVMLIPFGIARINELHGGQGIGAALTALHEHLPASYFQLFGSPALPDLTWYYIAAVSAIAGLTVIVQPIQLMTNAAARDESAARIGMITGSFIKRACTMLWACAGLIAALLYGETLSNSDLVWGQAAHDLLGPVRAGLVGLMLVGMLSALMVVSNSIMLSISGLVMANLYRPLCAGKSEQHYVRVGRISGILFLAGGAFIATQFDSLFDVLKLNWEYFIVLAGAFWLGLKWRRANRVGAWTSILVTVSLFYVIPLALPVVFPGLRSHPVLAEETIQREVVRRYQTGPGVVREQTVLLPARSIFWSQGVTSDAAGHRVGRGYPYLDLLGLRALGFDLRQNSFAINETIRLGIRLILPFALLALVARCTARDDQGLVDRFFVRMRTRVSSAGAEADSAHLAAAVRNPDHLRETKLFPASDWELYRWNRMDALGFVISVGIGAVMLGLLKAAVTFSF